ncbi:Ankyrin repeat family protein [Mycena venus]|uniref:Ankyrin repeat family protein n=1 Tax=Mycena venus TaxID=2733690 RepID=A0A8H6YNQ6_9AGAR|nr:Ankyrin repeat family protein [Mycena venus]
MDLNTLALRVKVKNHREHPRVIKNIIVKVKHPQFGDIVSLEAWRISRAHCADSFLEIMDEDMDEMHQFSVTLFDKYGNVRPHLVGSSYRSGTGCWGLEMNSGELLYIIDMNVTEPHRGKGVGTWTLLQFLSSKHVQTDDTVVCWPTPVGVRDKDVWKTMMVRQIAFFRKNHFRRIGRTGFFGYSPKSDHPSRSIPLDGDVGALDDNFSTNSTNPEDQQRQFPLHSAIVNDKTANVASTIQVAHDRDPASIHKPDDMGFTPLFVAVANMNLVATQKLLAYDLRADLENAVNAEGVTPLERLEDTMRSGREFAEMFGVWKGYSEDELTMQHLLKRAMDQPIDANITDVAKYGCTCNKCAGGWLSPRMRFRLETDAVFWADSMPLNFDMFTKGRPADPSAISMMDNPSDFIPPALYPNFYLSFYKGYCEVLRAIYNLLTTTDEVLSATGVMRFLEPTRSTEFFFQKGGRIEYAFDSITHCAQEQSPLGDDTFSETFGDYKDWVILPTCANDLEFQLVRTMIGLDRSQRWGPYHDSYRGGGYGY